MTEERVRGRLGALVRWHALTWLVAANAVGLLLALLQLWPDLGAALGPFGYGRWVPVHLDGQLYGWSALPLVGALLAGCLEWRHPGAVWHAAWALGGWSLALALGCASWLSGVSSGKLFLEWSGWGRAVLPLAMCLLWGVLAAHLWWGRAEWRTLRWRVSGAWVAALCVVPPMLHWAAGRTVFPSVNPHSGGATGASLLGSTLGLVLCVGCLPILLGVRAAAVRSVRPIGLLLGFSLLVLALLDHGNASHHAAAQVAGLGLLLAWIPAARWYALAWEWSLPAARWLGALSWWWGALVVDGWLLFLPGVSERLKFTQALVAHSHLAMAGALTSLGFALLNELDPARPVGQGSIFTWWHVGCVSQVVLLTALGLGEAAWPAAAFQGAAFFSVLLLLRLGAGSLMAVASWNAWRRLPL